MAEDISLDMRELVARRAGNRCEYCLLPQRAALHRHEPDHIIPRQHGGTSESQNLAQACLRCNRLKGPNVGSFDPQTALLTPFFHPRTQIWSEHFRFESGVIHPLTPEARVTVAILRLNDPERIVERQQLYRAGLLQIP